MGKRLSPIPSDIETGPRAARLPPLPPPLPPPHFSPSAPQTWFSWLIPLIFSANIAMFAYTMYENDCPSTMEADRCLFYPNLGRFSFQPFKENPLLGPSIHTLKRLGALEGKLVAENEGWRLISCIWLHAGVIHLLANMLSLLFIGIRLEQEFGFLRIGLLYVISGFGGSLMSSLHLQPSITPTVSVGASGALFGLLGAMLSELITNWTIYANKCASLMSLMLIIGLNLAVGFLPHVDNSAHIGGFLSGLLLGFVLLIRPQYGYVKHIPAGYNIKRKSKHKCYQYVLLITALVVLIIGYTYGLLKLFSDRMIENLPI